jgi:ribulose-phosphate 3-epimerase
MSTATELLAKRQIAPSILSADFSRLGSQVEEVMAAGARVIHVDVMDGHFVPPITIGPLVAGAIADQVHSAGGILDVHLMIEDPERQISEFAAAGADIITFHIEATPHAHRLVGAIHDAGSLAGLALNPGTAVENIGELATGADMLLCMTVNPGWGGQRFIESSPEKIRRIGALAGAAEGGRPPIEVDGGIDVNTAPRAVESGASILVAGSAIFAAPEPAEAYLQIAEAAGA